MDKQFEIMLRLFGAACAGEKSDIPPDTDVDSVVVHAHRQGVWQLVYSVISDINNASKYRLQFLTSVSEALRRNEFTLNVIEKIQNSGIDICILKGVVASSLYANPDLRISSDTDVLINSKDEKKVVEILRNEGYDVGVRNKNDHHIKCRHPIGGLMEVHISLYSEITDMIVFGGRIVYDEPYCEITYGKRKIKTLGINDNLKYLTAHYIKHLITGGASIRQMMDLLLYIKKYRDEIDFDKYNTLIASLKYDKLISAVKTVGAVYFGMDFEITETKLAEALVSDCKAVGLFGAGSDVKAGIYSRFCSARKEVSSLKLKILFMFKNEESIFNRLFPDKKILIKRGYEYASNTLLVPIAWIHNLFGHSARKKQYNEENNNHDILQKREELMKELGMID